MLDYCSYGRILVAEDVTCMPSGSKACEHLTFESNATVIRVVNKDRDEVDRETTPILFSIEMAVHCCDCGLRFRFQDSGATGKMMDDGYTWTQGIIPGEPLVKTSVEKKRRK